MDYYFLLASLVLFLFGYSDNKDRGSNNGNTTGNTDKDKVVELTLWNTWVDETAEASSAIKPIEDFNDNQDKIKIVLETTPHDQYKTKLKTQAAGKQLPELLQI